MTEFKPGQTVETIIAAKPAVTTRPSRFPTLTMHPLLQNPILYSGVDIKKLTRHSLTYEAWGDVYEELYPIVDAVRPNGYMLQVAFYVQGPESANILLSPTPNIDAIHDDPNVYELQLGVEGNSWSQIIRKSTGEVIARIYQQNLLAADDPLRVVIEISNSKFFRQLLASTN